MSRCESPSAFLGWKVRNKYTLFPFLPSSITEALRRGGGVSNGSVITRRQFNHSMANTLQRCHMKVGGLEKSTGWFVAGGEPWNRFGDRSLQVFAHAFTFHPLRLQPLGLLSVSTYLWGKILFIVKCDVSALPRVAAGGVVVRCFPPPLRILRLRQNDRKSW